MLCLQSHYLRIQNGLIFLRRGDAAGGYQLRLRVFEKGRYSNCFIYIALAHVFIIFFRVQLNIVSFAAVTAAKEAKLNTANLTARS